MNDEQRTALYVRIPQSHAEKLDRAAFELKVPKQDLVAGLVADMKIAPGFTRRRTEVVEVDDSLSVGRASFLPAEPYEVLTLADAAGLLQVDEDVVRAMAESGELPARKLGDEWRLSRTALLGWLGGEGS
jgi:excisionase family DNA binding protein